MYLEVSGVILSLAGPGRRGCGRNGGHGTRDENPFSGAALVRISTCSTGKYRINLNLRVGCGMKNSKSLLLSDSDSDPRWKA